MGKQILLLGIGQTGCEVGEAFLHRMQSDAISTRAFAVDTDARTFANIELAKKVPMVSEGSLHAAVERLGTEFVRDFFPSDWEKDGTDFARRLPMNTGANLWRMKAYISFLDFLGNRRMAERFHNELNTVADLAEGDGIELVTVASTVGGTGSGLFLPLALYVKKYFASIGARVVSSDCLLVMPEIYEHSLAAEQKVKGYANSYAALSELNAVNLAALGGNGTGHPPIGFKLGDERAKCGVLFDTERAEFCKKEAAPFDKVIIFERTPGVNSVGAHVNIIADVLVSVCKCGAELSDEEDRNESSTAVYEGISLTKVSYAPDSIVRYISKVQTEAILAGEIASLGREVKADTKKRAAEARSLRSRGDVDEVEQYCEALIFRAKNCMENVGSADALLARVKELPRDAEASNAWDDDFKGDVKRIFDALCESMDATLDCSEQEELERVIKPDERPADEDEDLDEDELAEDELAEDELAEDETVEDQQIDTEEADEAVTDDTEPDGETVDEVADETAYETEAPEETSEEASDDESEELDESEETLEDAEEELDEVDDDEPVDDEDEADDEPVPVKRVKEKRQKPAKKKKVKPLSAKQRRARLLYNASQVAEIIESYAKSLRSELSRGEDEFCASLLSEEGELSLIDSILAPGGVALHPDFALVRLCLLYMSLKRVVRDVPPLVEELNSDGELGNEIMLVDDTAGDSRYSRVGKRRFEVLTSAELPEDPELVMNKKRSKKRILLKDGDRVLVFTTEEELRRRMADDEHQFSEDVEYVRGRLRDAARHIRYSQACGVVAELINKYRRLSDAMSARVDDMTTDVKLAAINGGADSGVLVNVATSAGEKESICEEYLALYRADKAAVAEDDEAVGKLFLDFVKNGGHSDDVIEAVEAIYSERFTNSDYYKNNIEKNVIAAALDSMNGRFGDSGLTFGRVFRERFSPLRIIRGDDYPERRDLNNATVAIFPKEVWDYVADHSEQFDGDEPREFFEKKMYDAGEYRGSATYSDRIDGREFWIRRETSNVSLHLLETFNESARDATAYSAYRRAKQTAAYRSTAMWDPDLIYRRDDDMPRPMISPAARRDYELSVAKAVLHGLISGELYVSELEGAGNVYFTYLDGSSEPITLDGRTVGEKQVKELFAYAYANPNFTRVGAESYKTLYEGRYSLGGGFAGHREFASSLARSEKATKLAETFSRLLIKLYSAKALEDSGWARSLAAAVNLTVLGIAKNGERELDEKSGWIYNALVDKIMNVLVKEAKGERAKTLVKWLNDGGDLLRFDPPCEFKNYEI